MTQPILKRPDDLGMAEAFVRDRHLEAKFRALVKEYGVRTVVETGTWRGYTARRLAEFVPQVVTVENNPDNWMMALETLIDTNVLVLLGDSTDLLLGEWQEEMQAVFPNGLGHTLYYLDAHWGEDWPLFDELDIIAGYEKPCVIVIHDIKVPGKDFKFDTYKGQDLTLELIKPHLDKLRFPWKYEYNTESEGHKVGAVFITPIQ